MNVHSIVRKIMLKTAIEFVIGLIAIIGVGIGTSVGAFWIISIALIYAMVSRVALHTVAMLAKH
jgi:hypothetical protein